MPEGERNYRPHVISIYQLFPNTIVIWQVDHIEIWRAFPGRDDASHCDVEMTIYKPAASDRPDAYWEKNRDIAIRTVMEEDFPLGERMQIGFEFGRHRRGDLRPQRAVAGPFPYVDPQRAGRRGVVHWTAGLQARS